SATEGTAGRGRTFAGRGGSGVRQGGGAGGARQRGASARLRTRPLKTPREWPQDRSRGFLVFSGVDDVRPLLVAKRLSPEERAERHDLPAAFARFFNGMSRERLPDALAA